MRFFPKIKHLGQLGFSTLTEKTQEKSLEARIRQIEKQLTIQGVQKIEELLQQKADLQKQMEETKHRESQKRSELKDILKQQAQASKQERSEEHKDLNWTQRAYKEMKDLPIVTAVDDLIDGMTELEKMEGLIISHPNNPYVWLLFADALHYYRKTFFTVHGLKATFDFVGTLIDIGAESIVSVVDKEKWTYPNALRQAIYLGEKADSPRGSTFVVLGRSYQLLAREIKQIPLQAEWREKAEIYFKKALESEGEREEGEILYFLAELEKDRGNQKGYVSYLKESKRKGFLPALKELRLFCEQNRIAYHPKEMHIPKEVTVIKDFQYSYRKKLVEAAVLGAANVVNKQTKKILKWSNRVLDYTIDKFVK